MHTQSRQEFLEYAEPRRIGHNYNLWRKGTLRTRVDDRYSRRSESVLDLCLAFTPLQFIFCKKEGEKTGGMTKSAICASNEPSCGTHGESHK